MMAEAEASGKRLGAPHAPVRGRDPPLQPRPAGRLPPVRREGHHHPRRRHHREPVLRGQRRAALPLPRLRAAAARTRPTVVPILERALADPERGLGRLGVAVEPDALAALARLSDGDARTAAQRPRAGGGRAGRRSRYSPAAVREAAAAEGPALRQGGRGALQPDLRAPQVAPRLRRGRRALLAGPHAGGGRGPALRRAPARPLRLRGRRARRPAGARLALAAKEAVPLPRHARGRAGPRRERRLPRAGARSPTRSTRRADAAARDIEEQPAEPVPLAPPQRADAAHEATSATARATTTRTTRPTPW